MQLNEKRMVEFMDKVKKCLGLKVRSPLNEFFLTQDYLKGGKANLALKETFRNTFMWCCSPLTEGERECNTVIQSQAT